MAKITAAQPLLSSPDFSNTFSDDVISEWRRRMEKHPEANILQSPEWALVNNAKDDNSIFVKIGEQDFMLAIVRHAKRGRYIEVPAGPIIDWGDRPTVMEMSKKLTMLANQMSCAFVRIRPQLYDTEDNRILVNRLSFTPAPMHLGAQNTVIVNLEQSEDEILASFRRQTRYEVRQAMKQGIIVEKHTDLETFEDFHKLQLETAKRQHFVPPNFEELKAEHEAFGDKAVIYSAKTKEGELICYGLILKAGVEGDYFEAASTELGRKFPGAYAIQWQVIRDLKAEGYKRYNLFGIAPPNQPEHRYAKVTTFKTGFGEPINFLPAHDLIIDSNRYRFNVLVENIRKKKRHLG